MMAYRDKRFSALGAAHRQTHDALKALIAEDGKAEYRLHCQIVELLKTCGVHGLYYWHVPNGGKRDKSEAAKLKAMGVLPGVADLTLSIPGVGMAFLEVKSPRGRTTREQDAFLEAMQGHGHRVAVCSSLESAVSVLSHWGAIKAARVAA